MMGRWIAPRGLATTANTDSKQICCQLKVLHASGRSLSKPIKARDTGLTRYVLVFDVSRLGCTKPPHNLSTRCLTHTVTHSNTCSGAVACTVTQSQMPHRVTRHKVEQFNAWGLYNWPQSTLNPSTTSEWSTFYACLHFKTCINACLRACFISFIYYICTLSIYKFTRWLQWLIFIRCMNLADSKFCCRLAWACLAGVHNATLLLGGVISTVLCLYRCTSCFLT